MTAVEKLVTDHLDLWTSAIKRKSSAGRGSSKKIELYGIKKLRELILELAVHGLLIPQDPTDEPASELLKKIAAEKATLLKAGKIKKEKPLPPIGGAPSTLPKTWRWVRLGEVTNYGFCDKAEPEDVNEDAWILELEDVEKETSRLLRKVRFSERKFKSSKNIFKAGDVIYGKLRPYLDKVIVADEDGVCTTEMIPVRAYSVVTPDFLRISMKSPKFIEYANNATHGMNLPRVGTDKARLALIPVCSEAEQRRIVAKVDELMSVCDQLEQKTESGLSAHQTLVETLLAALTSAADQTQFTSIWQRIATHFDTLFSTEHSINQLQEVILFLAVNGVLIGFPASSKKEMLKDFLSFGPRNGFSPRESPSETGQKVLKLGATSYGVLDLVQTKFFDDEIPNTSHLWLKAGDILLQRGNSHAFVGSNVLIEHDFDNIIYPDLMMKLRVTEGVSPEYVSMWLCAPPAREHMWERMTGTSGTMPKISKSIVETIPIVVPPINIQEKVVFEVKKLMVLCTQLKARFSDAQTSQLHLADAITEQALKRLS